MELRTSRASDERSRTSQVRKVVEDHLNVTEDDLLEAQEIAASLSLEYVRSSLTQVYLLHKRDLNFPLDILDKIKAFLGKLESTPLPSIEDLYLGMTDMAIRQR